MSDVDVEDFGLADDLDGVVPERLVDNTYRCKITKSEIIKSKKDEKRYHILEWMVIQNGPYYGEDITEMYRVASKAEFASEDGDGQKAIKDARRKRIQRLESLGFKTDMESLRTTKPEDLLDTEAFLTISVRPKKNADGWNVWINSVELATSVGDVISDF